MKESAYAFVDLWNKDSTLSGPVNDLLMQREVKEHLRTPEHIVAAATKENRLCGVSIVESQRVARFDCPFYIYRHILNDPSESLFFDLIGFTRRVLERDRTPKDPNVGVMMIIASAWVKEHRRQAVWPEVDMTYMGETAKGHSIRIGYFRDARV